MEIHPFIPVLYSKAAGTFYSQDDAYASSMKSLMRFRGEMCPPGNALLIFCGAAAAVAAAVATLRERTGGDPIQDFHILLCTPGKVCNLWCLCVFPDGLRNISCCLGS